MLPIIVTSVAPVVGEVMDSFLKNMPKPADIVNVELSSVVQNLQRNVLLMRYENDRLEQYSRREAIKVVGVKAGEGGIPRRKCWIFSGLLAQISHQLILVVHRMGDRKKKGRSILVRFVSQKKRKEVMQKKKALKGKPASGEVYVFDDLTRCCIT